MAVLERKGEEREREREGDRTHQQCSVNFNNYVCLTRWPLHTSRCQLVSECRYR